MAQQQEKLTDVFPADLCIVIGDEPWPENVRQIASKAALHLWCVFVFPRQLEDLLCNVCRSRLPWGRCPPACGAPQAALSLRPPISRGRPPARCVRRRSGAPRATRAANRSKQRP